MTVAALSSTISYIENGVTTAFAAPFRFLPGTLVVERIDANGVVTVVAPGVGYAVSGGGTDAGGTVTLTSTIAGRTLRIRRATPIAQPDSFTTGDRFPAKTMEGGLDRETLIVQELAASLALFDSRVVKVPAGETAPVLLPAAQRQDRLLVGGPGGSILAIALASAYSGAQALTISSLAVLAGLIGMGNGQAAFLTDPRLFGLFTYIAGDLSAQVALDPAHGVTVPLATDPLGLLGAWVRDVTDGRLNALWFGARGVGNGFDDGPAIQAALDLGRARAGATVYLPWTAEMTGSGYYNFVRPLKLWPFVSIEGDPQRSKIKNLNPNTSIGNCEVFLPGNMHPGHLDPSQGSSTVAWKDCGTIAVGYTVTLSTPADAAGFAIGDQICVQSNDYVMTQTFRTGCYNFTGYVTGIAGAVLTLSEPIDRSFPGKIARYATATTWARPRLDPLFFWSHAAMRNLDIESSGSWMNDSSSLRCTFENLTTVGFFGFGGNSFQRCRVQNCDFFYDSEGLETSAGSYNVVFLDCRWAYKKRATLGSVLGGLSFQEAARDIRVIDCTLNIANYPGNISAITLIDCQDVRISNLSMIGGPTAYGGGALIQMQGSNANKAIFPQRNCVIENSKFHVSTCAFFVQMLGGTLATVTGNGVRNCKFSGTALHAFRVEQLASYFFFEDNVFETGDAVFIAPSSGGVIRGNYIAGGFTLEGSLSELPLRTNVVRGNTSPKTIVKTALRAEQITFQSAYTVVNGDTRDVYDVPISAAFQLRDEIRFDLLIAAGGNTGDRTIRIHLADLGLPGADPAPAEIDHTVLTLTIPAANSGYHRLTGSLHFAIATALAGYESIYYEAHAQNMATGGTTPFVGATNSVPFAANVIAVRIEGSCAAGNSTLNLRRLDVECVNPYYAS